ncbi:MAG TPA: GDP-mannose 4,6-dehydratase [Patescibacteria group bacterium]
MKKVLITGISGFAGSFLAEYLLDQGYSVSGTVLSGTTSPNISHIADKLQLFSVNLLEKESVEKIIADSKPDEIYHLAALTSPAKSFENPQETIMNNVIAEMNIFEAVKKAGLVSKILITSSAEVYGMVSEKDLPIDEQTPLMPGSPYAVSKITQDYLALQYFISAKIPVIRVRPFNHIGPRQAPAFVVARFASQIANIEKGKAEPILKVGNLSAKRDFTDVRDIVKGYVALIQKGTMGDAYNIGSGASYKIEDILNKLLSLSTIKVKVEVDPSVFRPVDVANLVCDITKIKTQTGWQPTIALDQTLKDTLDYWRKIV